jgi:hypothetical protein
MLANNIELTGCVIAIFGVVNSLFGLLIVFLDVVVH